jgi:hypothetical protein
MDTKNRINNLAGLRIEKRRLEALKDQQYQVVENDIRFVKKEYLSMEVIHKTLASMVPDFIRHSKYLNAPVNFIAEKLFHTKEPVVHETSDKGKGDRIRNVVLAIAETAAPFFLKGFLKKKLFK